MQNTIELLLIFTVQLTSCVCQSAGNISDRILLRTSIFLAKWRYCWFELLVQPGSYFVLWLGSKSNHFKVVVTLHKELYLAMVCWDPVNRFVANSKFGAQRLERAMMVIVKNLPRGNSASLKQKVCALKRQCCSMNSGIKPLSAMEKWQAIYTLQTCCKIWFKTHTL